MSGFQVLPLWHSPFTQQLNEPIHRFSSGMRTGLPFGVFIGRVSKSIKNPSTQLKRILAKLYSANKLYTHTVDP